MIRRILIHFLFLLPFVSAFGQNTTYQGSPSTLLINRGAIQVDSVLYIPVRFDNAWNGKYGNIRINRATGHLEYRRFDQWIRVAGQDEILDSIITAQLDTMSLSNRIDTVSTHLQAHVDEDEDIDPENELQDLKIIDRTDSIIEVAITGGKSIILPSSSGHPNGAGLMTRDQNSKLQEIEPMAEVNVQSDWNETNPFYDAYIKNKPAIPDASDYQKYTDTSAWDATRYWVQQQGYISGFTETDPTVSVYTKNLTSDGILLLAIKNVDGAGSGLDADLLDGQHGAYYRDRANHTGTQPIGTVSGLQGALDGKENAFAKGDIVAGTNATISGDLTGRLVGPGNVVFNVNVPVGYVHWNDTMGQLPTMYRLDTLSGTLQDHIAADLDLDPENELQLMAFNNGTRQLSISDGNTVHIPYVDTSSLSGRIDDRILYSDTTDKIATKSDLHPAVTLSGQNYLTLFSNQQIVAGQIDLGTGHTSGVLPVSKGGSGTSALNGYVKGNGTTPLTASPTIPYSDISGAPDMDNIVEWSDTVATIATKTDISGMITTETDPTVPAHVKAITNANITNWNQAFTWGNHAAAGYELQTNKRTNLASPNNTTYPTTQAVQNAITAIPTHDPVTITGQNYLTLVGQQITANAINLAGSHTTGNLPAARVAESSTKRFVTDAEKSTWNGKQDALGTSTGGKYLYQDQTWKQVQYSEIAGTPTIPDVSDMVEWSDTVAVVATQPMLDTLSATVQGHIAADLDLSPTNELQTISRSGDNVVLSIGGGSANIEDDDADPENELQSLSFNATNRQLTITDGNTVTIPMQDTASLSNRINAKENAFSKGNLVAGSNVTMSGTLTGRLVGAGNVTINATAPDLSGYVEWSDTVGAIATKTNLGNYIPVAQKGAADGVATLDAGGKVPMSQLPASLMIYQGVWNAATNTPTLVNGTGVTGWVYKASPGGTVNFGAGPISFGEGDWAIYNGTEWERSGNTETVVSVNGQQGVVNLDTDDIPEGTALYFTTARARQAISAGTGIGYNNTTGVVSNIAPNATHSGDASGATVLTINPNVVTNAKLADMAANTIKGRLTSSGDPQDLTAAQVRGLLGVSPSTDVQKYADTSTVDATRYWVGQQGYLTTEVDGSVTNELQSISRTGTNVTLSDGGGTVSIADNDNDPNNEIQTLSRVGDAVVLSGGGSASIVDGDADPANEIQNLALGAANSTTRGVNISGGTGVTIPSATTTIAGLMPASDKTKLNGIQAGAQVNAPPQDLQGVSVVGNVTDQALRVTGYGGFDPTGSDVDGLTMGFHGAGTITSLGYLWHNGKAIMLSMDNFGGSSDGMVMLKNPHHGVTMTLQDDRAEFNTTASGQPATAADEFVVRGQIDTIIPDVSGFVPSTRSVIAGNGLTGGGTLAADRTVTLGTPGSISAGSTNSVTATSHTHELAANAVTTAKIANGAVTNAKINDVAWSKVTGAPSFLTSESDPTVPAHVKSITTTEKGNWNTAFGWGNHASAGYEVLSNKATSLASPDNIKYPTTKAVSDAIAAIPSHNPVTLAGQNYLSLSGQQITAGAINLNSSHTTGTLPVNKGGSGATTLTGYLKGNGTSAFTAVSAIPYADISGTPAIPAQLNPTAGTGMSITGTYPNLTFTNTAPNQASNLAVGTRTNTTVPITNSNGAGVTIPAATTALAGVMTGTEKAKLNGIAAGAQVNVPTNLGSSLSGSNLTITSSTGSNTSVNLSSLTPDISDKYDREFIKASYGSADLNTWFGNTGGFRGSYGTAGWATNGAPGFGFGGALDFNLGHASIAASLQLQYDVGSSSAPGKLAFRTQHNSGFTAWKELADKDWANDNFITTNTTQTGLTGDKTTTGSWWFRWRNGNWYVDNDGNERLYIGPSTSGHAHIFKASGSTQFFRFRNSANTDVLTISGTTGQINSADLAGSGTRMMVANSAGTVLTQAIPSQPTNYVTTNTQQLGLTGIKRWVDRHVFEKGVAVGLGTQYALTAYNDGTGSYSSVAESTAPTAFPDRAISYDFAASGNFPSVPGFNHVETRKLWSGGNKAWQWVYPYSTTEAMPAPFFRSSVNNGSVWNPMQQVASREWVNSQGFISSGTNLGTTATNGEVTSSTGSSAVLNSLSGETIMADADQSEGAGLTIKRFATSASANVPPSVQHAPVLTLQRSGSLVNYQRFQLTMASNVNEAEVFYRTNNTSWLRLASKEWVTSQIPSYSGSNSVTVSGGVISRPALTGDVTAPANSNATTIANNAVTTAKIANNAVTYAKMQDINTQSIIGREAAGSGDPEQIKLGEGLEIASGELRLTGSTGWTDELGYDYEGNADNAAKGLDTRGGYASRTQTITTNAATGIDDDVEHVMYMAVGNGTINFPPAADFPNRVITISNHSTSSTVSFSPAAGETTPTLTVGVHINGLDIPSWTPAISIGNNPISVTVKSVQGWGLPVWAWVVVSRSY